MGPLPLRLGHRLFRTIPEARWLNSEICLESAYEVVARSHTARSPYALPPQRRSGVAETADGRPAHVETARARDGARLPHIGGV